MDNITEKLANTEQYRLIIAEMRATIESSNPVSFSHIKPTFGYTALTDETDNEVAKISGKVTKQVENWLTPELAPLFIHNDNRHHTPFDVALGKLQALLSVEFKGSVSLAEQTKTALDMLDTTLCLLKTEYSQTQQ